MPLSFVLLVLSICAVWPPLWAPLFAAAVLTAFVQGVVDARAVGALIALLGLAWTVSRGRRDATHWLAFALLVALCLALALHVVPGFANPKVIDAVRLTDDARPFTLFLNFDKGSAGLVLVALLSPKLRRGDRLPRLAGTTIEAYAATSIVVFTFAAASGFLRFEPKLPVATLLFLTTNLFLTCAAEEAFFRTLVQDPLKRACGTAWSIVASAALFGLAHAAGGPATIAMAALAGLGYAAVYARTGRIEASVLVHFGVNATHFLAFTYPALQAA